MGWVLLGILVVVAIVLLLRGPVRELRQRRSERARDRKRAARKEREEARRRGNPERAMNPERAAAKSGPPKWQQVAQKHGSKCWLCGTRTFVDDRQRTAHGERLGATYPTIDTVLSIDRGGSYAMDNLRIAHRHCAQVRASNPARTQYGSPPRTFGPEG